MSDDTETFRKPGRITKSTMIPLGLVISIVGAAVWIVIWLDHRLGALDVDMKEQQAQLKQSWSKQNQEIFQLKLKLQNPALNVPDMMDK